MQPGQHMQFEASTGLRTHVHRERHTLHKWVSTAHSNQHRTTGGVDCFVGPACFWCHMPNGGVAGLCSLRLHGQGLGSVASGELCGRNQALRRFVARWQRTQHVASHEHALATQRAPGCMAVANICVYANGSCKQHGCTNNAGMLQ
jgi:hypothetical protein